MPRKTACVSLEHLERRAALLEENRALLRGLALTLQIHKDLLQQREQLSPARHLTLAMVLQSKERN